LAELETSGQLDNTLVIYTADHGLNCGQHGIWEKGNATMPQNFLEESILVGCTLSWPAGGIWQNKTIDCMINHCDLYATLLDIAGATPDPKMAAEINSPGRSYLPLLLSRPVTPLATSSAPGPEANVAPEIARDAQFLEYGNARMARTDG